MQEFIRREPDEPSSGPRDYDFEIISRRVSRGFFADHSELIVQRERDDYLSSPDGDTFVLVAIDGDQSWHFPHVTHQVSSEGWVDYLFSWGKIQTSPNSPARALVLSQDQGFVSEFILPGTQVLFRSTKSTLSEILDGEGKPIIRIHKEWRDSQTERGVRFGVTLASGYDSTSERVTMALIVLLSSLLDHKSR